MDTNQPPLRILIADDYAPVRQRIARMLAELKEVEIVGETSGVEETLLAIRQFRPCLVTLDLSLRDGNGLDVLRRTQGEPLRPRFIVLTGNPNALYANEAARLGALAFLDKALEFDQLTRLILAQQPGQACLARPFVSEWELDEPSQPVASHAA